MKLRLFSFLFLFSFVTSPLYAKPLILGEALTLTTVTKVSEINAHPQEYLGKRVLIEGLVIDVCGGRGCWMDIASDLPFEKIQVKVVDGEIVFPLETKGRTAKVEGEVEELKLTREDAIQMGEHRAAEQGKKFDPATVTGPVTYYRIHGIGAVIE